MKEQKATFHPPPLTLINVIYVKEVQNRGYKVTKLV